jgi:hypothetical protein
LNALILAFSQTGEGSNSLNAIETRAKHTVSQTLSR